MITPWEEEWQDAKPGQIRFFAEFTWDGTADYYAREQFKEWHKGLFPVGAITHENTQGFYMVGTRTFWIISSANDWDEVVKFCNKVAIRMKADAPTIGYNYYAREDPQPPQLKELKP
jgi:hypothetical protein